MFGESSFKKYHCNGYKFLKISGERESKQPLILLHGMFGGLSNYDPLICRMPGFTIVVPDIPLYDLQNGDLNIQGLAGWLAGFFDAHSLQDAVLLGNSMGGHIALEFARIHPERLSGLVLTGSSGLFENDFGTTCPKRNDREYIKKRAALTFYDDLVTDELVDEIMDITQCPQKLPKLLKIARSTHSYNMESELADIAIPTLLIWGREDMVTPPEVANIMKAKLPDARLKWIERCGHAPMMERPDEFAKYLKEFLNTLNRKSLNKTSDNRYEENYSHR